MQNVRLHGQKPFLIGVVHGGPGAPGEVYPVARELSCDTGVLEPLQTADSIEGEIEELRLVLEIYGHTPLVLVGFSWGAWLSYLTAAYHPHLVKKLILVSSGPFEEEPAVKIMQTRLSRLNEAEKQEVLALLAALKPEGYRKKDFARLGELMTKADTYAPLPPDPILAENRLEVRPDIYQKIWPQAAELRSNGQLLEQGKRIRCPVTAIHGDYDPHPAAGIEKPLSRVLKDFHFILLEKCGHEPWMERFTRDEFYRILRQEAGL